MMDEDGDGAIDADELRVAFAALGIDATHAQCVAEIRRVDRDRGKGTILFPEFVALVIGEPNAASGRDGPRSRLSGRERAARRLAAGADADSDARVVLAEANVGPEGQGMERALADEAFVTHGLSFAKEDTEKRDSAASVREAARQAGRILRGELA